MTLTNTTTSIQPRVRPGMPPHSTETKKTGDRHRVATPLRRRTALIVSTRGAGRIRTGPYMRGGGTRRGGTVTWQPPSIPKAWPPGQVRVPPGGRTLLQRARLMSDGRDPAAAAQVRAGPP